MEQRLRDLNDCGCCEGTESLTPELIHNAPSLETIEYRVGTHATFKESMLAALSSNDRLALAKLTTRDDDEL